MEVVDLKDEQCSWFPISGNADTVYVGQLVKMEPGWWRGKCWSG